MVSERFMVYRYVRRGDRRYLIAIQVPEPMTVMRDVCRGGLLTRLEPDQRMLIRGNRRPFTPAGRHIVLCLNDEADSISRRVSPCR
jgi:hypothetical protein